MNLHLIVSPFASPLLVPLQTQLVSSVHHANLKRAFHSFSKALLDIQFRSITSFRNKRHLLSFDTLISCTRLQHLIPWTPWSFGLLSPDPTSRSGTLILDDPDNLEFQACSVIETKTPSQDTVRHHVSPQKVQEEWGHCLHLRACRSRLSQCPE